MTTTTTTETTRTRAASLTNKVVRGLVLFNNAVDDEWADRHTAQERGDIEAAGAWLMDQATRRGLVQSADADAPTPPPPAPPSPGYGPGTRAREVAERIVRDSNAGSARAAAAMPEGGEA